MTDVDEHGLQMYKYVQCVQPARRLLLPLVATTVLVVALDADDTSRGLLLDRASRRGELGTEHLARTGVGSDIPDLHLRLRSRSSQRERVIWRPCHGEDFALYPNEHVT